MYPAKVKTLEEIELKSEPRPGLDETMVKKLQARGSLFSQHSAQFLPFNEAFTASVSCIHCVNANSRSVTFGKQSLCHLTLLLIILYQKLYNSDLPPDQQRKTGKIK